MCVYVLIQLSHIGSRRHTRGLKAHDFTHSNRLCVWGYSACQVVRIKVNTIFVGIEQVSKDVYVELHEAMRIKTACAF